METADKQRPLRFGGYLKRDFEVAVDGHTETWRKGDFVALPASDSRNGGYVVKMLRRERLAIVYFAHWSDVEALLDMAMGDSGAPDPKPPAKADDNARSLPLRDASPVGA